jgi:protein-tyrosine phosphatase
MGNICRSPTAEAVLRQTLADAGMEHVEVDSAGTYGGHAGRPPDERAIAHGARRGYDLSPQRARQVRPEDFDRFDWLLAMDGHNESELLKLAPAHQSGKVRRLMSFAPPGHPATVPDPYYGGAAGFEKVLDLIELGCSGFVEHLRSEQGVAPGKPAPG